MKRSNQLHYTPAPILNPDRRGTGLYSSVSNDSTATLASSTTDFDFDEVDMIDFFEKPRVNIGTDYQATLPTTISTDTTATATSSSMMMMIRCEERKPCETLLWKPNVLDDDRQLNRFIDLAKSSAVPMGTHSIESALKILMESQGEVHVAVLKLLQSSDKSLEKRWSQTEMEQFLKGLEKHGKDFATIARDILHKTTGDCVQLYYFWKKLCNEYKSTHLPQRQSSARNLECNFNANKHNNNDDFFDYVDNSATTNNATTTIIQNGHNNNNNNTNHNSELRPHVCEVPDCSAVSKN